MKNVWLCLVILLCSMSLHAQAPGLAVPFNTTPPDLLEGAQHFTVTGTYAASSGNQTNNGFSASMEFRFSNHVSARIDQFGLTSPASTTLSFAEIQGKWSLAHIIKPSQFFNTSPILVSLHAGPGAVKGANGGVAIAGAAGMSVDYDLGGGFFIRPIDVTVAYSRGLANHFIVLGTWTSVQSGLGFRF